MKNLLPLLAVAALWAGGCASPDAPQEAEQSLAKRAVDRGSDIEVDSNINQINQALMMIKQEGNGAPATLEEAKRAAKVPNEMWTDSVSGKPLVYDAATGTVHREGVAAGGAPTDGAKNVTGGIVVPDGVGGGGSPQD